MATTKPTPIGINLPIRVGNVGYFDQSIDTFSAIKNNIINLIRTIPGERRMNPTFGCRLWNLVFEQNDDFLPQKVSNMIKEDIAAWIPGVTVSSVNVQYKDNNQSTDLRDTYKLYITITFTVTAINQSDTVNILIDTNKV
jgi:phage baseplate assembly protein W